ncbi:hypothetical protein [Ligilactobacillus salivarius]|uniref:Uncharacterized protein n=1 Tax=Ligilactobacillus salivarius NIAS840 TaxID=1029822 RepID=F5VFM0_9LACO|nr:hypothetical protein [Ligilactobacillus salivarius]EGL98159.1 hypothetical protein NIAS840_01590 [Ligilactobacillus salivarius NIAS840]
MNELKDMTKDELLDELESKNIHVVSNETLSNYSDAMNDIMQAFMEIVDDVNDNYFNEPTQKQLETLWQEENQSWSEVGGEVEPFDEEFAKSLYYRKNVGQAIEDDAVKFLSWLDDKNRFFTYVSLEDDSEFVDLIEYHPCTNLESYLLEDKQALEQVLCQQ